MKKEYQKRAQRVDVNLSSGMPNWWSVGESNPDSWFSNHEYQPGHGPQFGCTIVHPFY